MSMGMPSEGFVTVPPNGAAGTKVRMLQYQIAQAADGSMQIVNVEPTVLLDATTGLPVTPLTSAQGEAIIKLLRQILKAVEK